MVTWRVEQVAAMRRVNVEEDTRDDDRLLLEQFLEERLQSLSVLARELEMELRDILDRC